MSSRNKKTRCLWSTLVIITVTACISLFFVYLKIQDNLSSEDKGRAKGISLQEKFTEEECVPICDTKECVWYAKFLLGNLKPTSDPCENAHTFMCGAYEEKFSQEERKNVFFDTETNMFKILDDILKNIQADPESASGKMKTAYDSCMNYASAEKQALPTAERFLDNIGIPNWPHIAPDFEFFDADISTILGNLKAQGEMIFLTFIVPNRRYISPDLAVNKLNLSVQLDARFFHKFLQPPKNESIVHILSYFELDSEAVEEILHDYNVIWNSILKLKDENCRILNLDCPDANDRETWYAIYNEECRNVDLDCTGADDDWTYLCKAVEVFLNNSKLNEQINKDYIKIEGGDDHFVKHIIQVLNNFPHRTFANFLALNFYLNHLEELNFYFQLTKSTYFPRERCSLWKPPFSLDRWRFCTEWISRNMNIALEYEFFTKYLTLSELEKILDLFEECKSEAVDIVSHQQWMPEEDREKLMDEIQILSSSMNSWKEFHTHMELYKQFVNDYYNLFLPRKDNFLHNALEMRRSQSDIKWLLSPFSSHVSGAKFETQATFLSYQVEIRFGILVPPQYITGLHRLLNLVLFSTTAGHEFGHGFEEIIEKFLGNITKHKVEERSRCLINQYSQFKYEFSDKKLNASKFFSENFADSVGATIVNKLIEKYNSNKEDFLLPGLNYTSTQFMYIAAGQLWCTKTEETEELLFQGKEQHSPSKYRLISPMQNSRGYSKAFNCPEGSYMNPSTKCSIVD